ncbi:hypothetical protein NOM73_01000 [Erwinia persicina]|uniref:hypothetical protein n=1 Tax=Erwinia persicina TaxID=55211 RepID=UPI00210DE3B8|nr:hypothetical protein [Erwinia persicina]MCQ4093232.1 hypothetical protein [Erwinia persicina]MCQ4099000.1 hypothetical protein [Erwinia persicina]
MIQSPHSINRSGLNHRGATQGAIAFQKRILGITGRREGITCCGAVVIALADPSKRWSKKVKPHGCFLNKTRQSVFKSEYLSGSGPASLKAKKVPA